MFEVSTNSKLLVERSIEPIKTIKILTFYQERETSLYHVRRKQERGKLGFFSCAVNF